MLSRGLIKLLEQYNRHAVSTVSSFALNKIFGSILFLRLSVNYLLSNDCSKNKILLNLT